MTDFFAAIERTPFSIWMREDFYAYFIALIFHALGMALLVGGGVAVSLRLMGLAKGTALEKFAGFFPVMWAGAALALASGLILLWSYPAKALTNPLFYVKLTSLVGAALLVRFAARRLFPMAARAEALPGWSRWVGAGTLALWLGVVVFGKLLLHTATVLTVWCPPELCG